MTDHDDVRALLSTLPRPSAGWFLRSSGEDGAGTIHGSGHALRVAAHAAELALEVGVSPAEREALLLAALWHDIGREHDGGDYFHGARSAGKVLGLGLHLSVEPRVLSLALLVITYHVPDDGWGERAARDHDDPAAAQRVLRVLKDADALDRVRLGPQNLKPQLLRLPASRRRIDRAWALLRATTEEVLP